jgi:hypothetical protein
MVLPGAVTTDAQKIGDKLTTPTVSAMPQYWVVPIVRTTTLALATPGVDVETFSSGQPPIPDFFRTGGNKVEAFAFASLALARFSWISRSHVLGIGATTKTFGPRTDPCAVVFAMVAIGLVSDVNACGYSHACRFLFKFHDFLWPLRDGPIVVLELMEKFLLGSGLNHCASGPFL